MTSPQVPRLASAKPKLEPNSSVRHPEYLILCTHTHNLIEPHSGMEQSRENHIEDKYEGEVGGIINFKDSKIKE
jgi:hypothetical protein